MQKLLFTLLVISWFEVQFAQDINSLLDDLAPAQPDETVEKTFRAIRVVNAHSNELLNPGELVMSIGHRFGQINTGFYELFGLDQATMRLGFDYGIYSWLTAGVGRSTFQKSYDVYLKPAIIKQGSLPFSVTGLAAASVPTLRDIYPPAKDKFKDKVSIVTGLMISRKFSELFSLQIHPVWIHHQFLPATGEQADDLSLGIATRLRVTPRVHINLEYLHELVDEGIQDKNPLSVGFDIETGGHVFQLFFSNTQGIIEKAYLTHTTGTWAAGEVYFGFTITRVFYTR
jgi:hypothetical protein